MFYESEPPAEDGRLTWRCPKCGHLPHFDAILAATPGRAFRDDVLARSAEICDQVRTRERITVGEANCAPGRGRCESCGVEIGNYHAAGCAALDDVE